MASSQLNAGQQVGSSIGLAVPGTVAWTVMANSVNAHDIPDAGRPTRAGRRHPPSGPVVGTGRRPHLEYREEDEDG